MKRERELDNIIRKETPEKSFIIKKLNYILVERLSEENKKKSIQLLNSLLESTEMKFVEEELKIILQSLESGNNFVWIEWNNFLLSFFDKSIAYPLTDLQHSEKKKQELWRRYNLPTGLVWEGREKLQELIDEVLSVFEQKLEEGRGLEKENKELQNQLKQLQTKDYENRMITLLEEEKKSLEDENKKQKERMDFLSKNFERCEKEISKISPEIVKLSKRLEGYSVSKVFLNNLRLLVEELPKYERKRNEKENSLQKSLKELQEINQDLENQLKDLSANDEETQKLKKDLENLTLAFGLTSSQLSETQTKLNQLELQSEQNQIRLKSYEEEIQNIIKLKTSLENDNQEYEKTNQELKAQLAQNKDKISSLEGERNFLNNNLNRLSGELEITLPETEPEKKSIQEKIEFFIDYFKQVQTQKEELEEKFQQETQVSQELRQSLNELEEKLNQSDNSNLQNIRKITNENRDIRKKIKDLELELAKEKQEVSLLNGQLSAEEESLKKAGVKIQIIQKENQTYKNKIGNWKKWALGGVIIGVLISIGVIVYKKLRG